MYPSPKFYSPSFVEIGPLIREKKDVSRVVTIYGRGGHLGHVTQMSRANFVLP